MESIPMEVDMPMFKSLACAAVVLASASALPAAAATTVVAASCTSVKLADGGCEFEGNINGNANLANANSYLHAQNAYNLFNDTHPSANPDIVLNFLSDTTVGAGTTSGTWSLPGFLVDFFAVKAGDGFVLYQLASPTNSYDWSTAGLTNKKGDLQGLSHIAFFGVTDPGGAVPEPATWAMMILGLGCAGAVMRRRLSYATLA
jgi:hypothetical protein